MESTRQPMRLNPQLAAFKRMLAFEASIAILLMVCNMHLWQKQIGTFGNLDLQIMSIIFVLGTIGPYFYITLGPRTSEDNRARGLSTGLFVIFGLLIAIVLILIKYATPGSAMDITTSNFSSGLLFGLVIILVCWLFNWSRAKNIPELIEEVQGREIV